jgi:hypothetical protein
MANCHYSADSAHHSHLPFQNSAPGITWPASKAGAASSAAPGHGQRLKRAGTRRGLAPCTPAALTICN